jgi:uncharacterized membrane protein YoaK (UPF0700 family)
MTAPAGRAPSAVEGPRTRIALVLAALLAVVAGCVDAVSFTHVFDVFPANQSGNAVLLGMGIGGSAEGLVWRSAFAIVGFGAGVAVAILLGTRLRARRGEALLAVELFLLVPLAAVVFVRDDPTRISGPGTALLIVLTACAMGVQTEVIRHVAGVAVATTYQSGAIARMAEDVAHTLPLQRARTYSRVDLAVLLSVLLAYVAGAAIGAAIDDGRGSMLLPVALLVVVGLPLARRVPSSAE